tara:strand:+ start:680 stop:892 length:213 start_codon:yes stop_codon:yes gene_type:complete
VAVVEQVIQLQEQQDQVQEQEVTELLSQVDKKFFYNQDLTQLQLVAVEQEHVLQQHQVDQQMHQMVRIQE